MVFFTTLICVTICAFILKGAIKKVPWVFYLIGIALVVLFVGRESLGLPFYFQQILFALVQKCTLAQALFVVVMFIGVFDDKSRVKSHLAPIRAELSILGGILAFGHIISYFTVFAPKVFAMDVEIRLPILLAFYLALLLVALLITLGLTSFSFVKRHMNAFSWKKLQWLAYPFFLLIYVHILLFLLPPTLLGANGPLINIAVYTAIFVSYIALRVRKGMQKRSATIQEATAS
jgi:DMSO/TMAO reductase YedYZ heme-binding membrane subunit